MVEASAVSTNFLDTDPTMLGQRVTPEGSPRRTMAMPWRCGSRGRASGEILPAMTMASRYDAATGRWEAPAILSNTASMEVVPSRPTRGITGDGRGNYLAFWEQFDSSQRVSVWVNRYVAGSGWQGPQAVFETEPLANTVPYPQAAMAYDSVAGVSKAVVAWRVMSASGDPADLMVNRLTNFAANTWSGASLAESRAVAISSSILVDMAANGDFLLTFSESTELYYRHYQWSTGWSGPESTVESRPEKIVSTKLAMNEAGVAIVSWLQSTGPGGTSQLWARRWNGSDWAAEAQLLSDDPDNYVGSPAVAISDNGEAVVSYTQLTNGTPYWDLYVRRHDGAAWQDSVKVDSEDLGNVASSGNLAIDDSGNILAAWGQGDGEFQNAWSTTFDRSTAAWSAAAKLENTAFNTGLPLVAMNSSGVATVVWGQPDNTLYHIYASRTTVGGSPLLADARSPASMGSGTQLVQQDAAQAVAAAISLWVRQMNLAELPQVNVRIADLPAGQLGRASCHTITLDSNANGAGWFVDATPWEHSEFVGLHTATSDRVDLLTVVTHEIGHVLGKGHSIDTQDVMAASLPLGTRRLPGLGQVEIEPSNLGQSPLLLSTATSHAALTEHEPRVRTLPPSAAGKSDFYLLNPLARQIVEQSTSRPESIAARILRDVLDEQTELLDKCLLDLLAQAAV